MATGVALKINYKKEDGVVLCYFGDGAIHQGAFHESLNLAKIWDLPVIYICENNHYGMGTAFHRVSSVHDFSIMGDSYGIPGKQIDGMNVLEVYEEVSQAVQQARIDKLASFLEIKTYRYRGHSMSDPAKYRTKDELNEYKGQDPILLLKAAMLEKELLTEEAFAALDKECKHISDAAVEFSENSDEPALETLYEDVLV